MPIGESARTRLMYMRGDWSLRSVWVRSERTLPNVLKDFLTVGSIQPPVESGVLVRRDAVSPGVGDSWAVGDVVAAGRMEAMPLTSGSIVLEVGGGLRLPLSGGRTMWELGCIMLEWKLRVLA